LEYLATGDIKIRHKKSNQKRIYAKINPSNIENQTLGSITFYTKNKRHVIEHLDASPFEQYLRNDSLSNEGAASPPPSSEEGAQSPLSGEEDDGEPQPSSNKEKAPSPPSEAVSQSPKKKQNFQFPPTETNENDFSFTKEEENPLLYDPSTDSLYTRGKGSILPSSPLGGGSPDDVIPVENKSNPDNSPNTNKDKNKNEIKKEKVSKKKNIPPPAEEEPVATPQPPAPVPVSEVEENPAELEGSEVLSDGEDIESD
jgi:hypothetical protein